MLLAHVSGWSKSEIENMLVDEFLDYYAEALKVAKMMYPLSE